MKRRKIASKLQLITDCPEQTEQACRAGIRWIQVRIKDADLNLVKNRAEEMVRICRKFRTRTIINDHPDIALAVKADGVHLGKQDMSVQEARKRIGTRKMIIGGTANTLEDMVFLSRQKVDYIGLGPFRFTHTKKNLSPVLGLDGYRNLMKQWYTHSDHFPPVYAIGGIRPEDVSAILQTGIHGIAVSSAITEAVNPALAVRSFMDHLQNGATLGLSTF